MTSDSVVAPQQRHPGQGYSSRILQTCGDTVSGLRRLRPGVQRPVSQPASALAGGGEHARRVRKYLGGGGECPLLRCVLSEVA